MNKLAPWSALCSHFRKLEFANDDNCCHAVLKFWRPLWSGKLMVEQLVVATSSCARQQWKEGMPAKNQFHCLVVAYYMTSIQATVRTKWENQWCVDGSSNRMENRLWSGPTCGMDHIDLFAYKNEKYNCIYGLPAPYASIAMDSWTHVGCNDRYPLRGSSAHRVSVGYNKAQDE